MFIKKKKKNQLKKIGIGVSAKADEKNIGIVSALKNRYRSIPNVNAYGSFSFLTWLCFVLDVVETQPTPSTSRSKRWWTSPVWVTAPCTVEGWPPASQVGTKLSSSPLTVNHGLQWRTASNTSTLAVFRGHHETDLRALWSDHGDPGFPRQRLLLRTVGKLQMEMDSWIS